MNGKDPLIYESSVVIRSKLLSISLREERDIPVLMIERRQNSLSVNWKSSVFKGTTEVSNQIQALHSCLSKLALTKDLT